MEKITNIFLLVLVIFLSNSPKVNATILTDEISREKTYSIVQLKKSLISEYGFDKFLKNNNKYKFFIDDSHIKGYQGRLKLNCGTLEEYSRVKPGESINPISIDDLIDEYIEKKRDLTNSLQFNQLKYFIKSCPEVGFAIETVLKDAYKASEKYQNDLANPLTEIGQNRVRERQASLDLKKLKDQQAAERESQRIQTAKIKNKIDGYKDFTFGSNIETVKALKKICHAYYPADIGSLVGTECYKIAGAWRTIKFNFGKEGLERITIYLGGFNNITASEIMESLNKKYNISYKSSDYVWNLFNRRVITDMPIAAFDDWSVVYLLAAEKNEEPYIAVIYQTDRLAAAMKTRLLSFYSSHGDGKKIVKPSDF
jgi:hypothetical protein